MSLDQSLAQMRANVRDFANIAGTTALARFPDLKVNEAILRAIGSLYRKLNEARPGQRYLNTNTITMVAGQAAYPLPSDFESLISVDLSANGVKIWLDNYTLKERPTLTDPSEAWSGVPFGYRIEGNLIEFLPTPQSATYISTLWYVPNAPQPDQDAKSIDTIERLDDYIIAYASRIIATKDKAWDLVAECRTVCEELDGEIKTLGRSRDRNGTVTIVDTYQTDRFGRNARRPRTRWR